MKLGIRNVKQNDGTYAEHWGPIDRRKFLAIEGLEVTHDFNKSDLIFVWNTLPNEFMKTPNKIKNPEKFILFLQESPVAHHRIVLYENIDKFHTVITHNPNGPNQIPYSDDPSVYPWNPFISIDLKREDTTIKNRNFFYAARRGIGYEDMPDRFDTHVLYGARAKMIESFKNKFPGRLKLYGVGWLDYAKFGKSAKMLYEDRDGSWRRAKVEDVEDSGADFHIVLENCIQKNLITDHFHDGFNSDRVVFYLGCPNIYDYVPKDIFIDLRPFYNKETKELDIDKIVDIADNMTQEEYDGYINRARAWRETLKDKSEEKLLKLTDNVVNRIKEYINE